ncbi:MAG: hypothetical protein ACREQX_12770 [Candidatus Binataceae bacterium]
MHPLIRAATDKVRQLCRERGIALAAAVNQPDDMTAAITGGAQFLLYGTDLVLIRREAQRAAAALATLRTDKPM